MFAVFNAMDFNKFLLSQFIPALHGKMKYDGMRIVLRHFTENIRKVVKSANLVLIIYMLINYL